MPFTTNGLVSGVSAASGLTESQVAAIQSLTSGSGVLWANRPAAASVPGQTIRVTDIGPSGSGSHWVSDGTYWRPVGGSALIAAGSGSLASPIQTLTGSTGGTFTSATVTIPANLLAPGAQLEITAHVRRTGANGTGNFNMAIGTTGTASDANIMGASFPATTGIDMVPAPYVCVNSATSLSTTNWLQINGVSTGAAAVDVSSNFNIASPMFVTFYTSSANALDSFSLIKYRVRVIQ